jgi:hypothetical protein
VIPARMACGSLAIPLTSSKPIEALRILERGEF